MGYRWKRLRLSLRNRRDSNAFEIAARELKEMEQIPDANVVYFDESHFTISGVVSYAWQPKGERTLIPFQWRLTEEHSGTWLPIDQWKIAILCPTFVSARFDSRCGY